MLKNRTAARAEASSRNGAAEAAPLSVVISGLTKRYANGTLANDGIDLAIASGTTLGVLGRNGAGKTTLVRQITGELGATSGSVLIHGIDVLREPLRARQQMGVVPQEATPYEHLRPHEHLALFGRLHGLSRAEARRRAEEMLDLLTLREHASKIAQTLSGGLKRKLLVGTALMGDPALLVLDEPTTGLDPHARHEVWSLLRDLRGRGRTIIITTHYMEEAEELCDRVALISRGRLRAEGTIEELRSRCRTSFKATYEGGSGRQTVFGPTSEAVLADLRQLGVQEFALTRSSLEDVYMELTHEDQP